VVASDILNKISGLVNPEQRGLLAASSGFDDISTDAEGFRRTASKPRVTDAEPEPLSFEQPAEYPATTLEFTKASHRPEREVSGASAMDLTDISLRRPEHHVEQILDNIGKHF
jgi:hypothetical protein